MTNSANPDKMITEQFLVDLRARFEITLETSALVDEFEPIARRYAVDLRVFSDEATERTLRSNYQTLKSETARFRELLFAPEYEDLETDLYWAVRHKIAPVSDANIPVIGHAQGKPGSFYLSELENLLALLDSAADLGIARFAPIRGRKRKYVLENLVRRLAYVWADMLGRKFTVDYHKGSGLTEAFAFVSLVVTEMDSAVTENEIITAMRTIIKERGQ
jgi:hypothetical protein